METFTAIHAIKQRLAAWRKDGQRVALVPTMGNLHDGHLSLVAEAQRRADRVVVSAFVNPLQFGPAEDFDKYPRTLKHDLGVLQALAVDALFHPGVSEMYPAGHERSTVVDVPELSGILCGAHRPGHFAGVATVVTKLLNIVAPQMVMFGEKDYQQLILVRRLVADLCVPVEVVGMPTVREPDGLALSSRNRFLTEEERHRAPALYRSLQGTRQRIEAGEREFAALERSMLSELEAAGFKMDYFAILSEDLQPLQDDSQKLVLLAAGRLGSTRLIDNLRVSLAGSGSGSADPASVRAP